MAEDPLPPDAESIGVAAWLTKPVRQSQLFDTLRSVASGATERSAGKLARPQEVQWATPTAVVDGPRILVVEDTPINQQVARGMLARLGYTAEVAADGFEALEALSRGSYAAILMDCQMPRMDGFEASRVIRQREGAASHTPIIAMAASVTRGERERCLAAGMDDYLAKPVLLRELQARLWRWSASTPEEVSPVWAPSQWDADAPAQAHTEAASLDPQVLLGLRSFQIAGEEDPMARLVDLFLTEAPARLERIRAALDQRDPRALQAATHALKGSAGALGAYSVQEVCGQLEEVAESGTVDGAPDIVQALEAALARARSGLEELRSAEHS
jgi:two-component system, sensor histidine kinase and response regulator